MSTLDPTPPKQAPSFSWLRGLLHAGLIFIVFIVVSFIVSAENIKTQEQANKLGEGLGKMGAWVLVLALVCSYGVQTKKRLHTWLGGGGVSLMFAFIIGIALLIEPPTAPSRELTEDDRQALLVLSEGTNQYLKHPHLGFTLNHPGEKFRYLNDEQAKALAKSTFGEQLDVQLYGFLQEDTGEFVAVLLSGETVTKRYLEGFMRGFEKQAPQIIKKEIFWEEGKREATIQAKVSPLEISVRALAASLGPKPKPYFLAIIASSLNAGTSQALTNSLRWP